MITRNRYTAALLSLVLALGGCDNLLEVETAGRIPAEQLENPANAALLVSGAIADFECAFGAYTVVGGLIGEELDDATQTADRFPFDQRTIRPSDSRYATQTCENLGVYTPLQTARSSADRVAALLEAATDAQVPNRLALLATAKTYAGYSLLLTGEGFCSGTISTIGPNGQVIFGPELSRTELLQEAIQRFTAAIAAAQAANNTELLYTALLGRARALVSLGRFAEARQDAARVPASFVRNATASGVSSRRENRVFAQNSASSTSTSIGAPFRALNDPRVPVTPVLDDLGRQRTSTTGVPLFRQGKFSTSAAPIALASGDEAQLIIAEAAARAGELQTALDIINNFRRAAGQPTFSSTNQAAVLAEGIEQRRRDLFLESHHLGDLIRLNTPFQPAPGAAFPGGGVYGSQRCLPLPDIERLNNPNID